MPRLDVATRHIDIGRLETDESLNAVNKTCVVEVDNYGGGSVMVWGAISDARKTQLGQFRGI